MLKQNILQRILAFWLLTLTMVALPPILVIAAPDVDIEMSVSAGYDDAVKIGFPVPFYVHLKNSGSEISGELQIIVNNNPESRSVYSMPFTLPQNSDKELVVKVPVNTIDRKIEIKLVKGNTAIKTTEYEFKKFIPPNTPFIGVLSDDPNSIKGLNEVNLPDTFSGIYSDMAMKYSSAVPVREGIAASNILAEQAFLNAANLPEDAEALSAFNVLILSNFDTTFLSQNQKDCLDSWVSKGNILIMGTGSNWKKVYGGLPDRLKPFKIDGTKPITKLSSLGQFTGKQSPSGNLSIATGNAENGRIAAFEEKLPLIIHYKVESGFISVLTFDPSLSPISNWDDVQVFWKSLINSLYTTYSSSTSSRIMPTRGSYMNLNHLASNVPESQTPPYKFLLIMIGVYILIAGPVIYIILKWRDKRDWSWIAIPATAFLFLGIIYVTGFKTRFTTAVLNNVSVINISPNMDNYHINTIMGVFNNKRGSMKIQYPSAADINANPNYYINSGYYNSQKNTENDAIISSKLTYSDPKTYELYQARLWQPAYLEADKTIPSKGEVMNTVSLVDGKFKTVIKNKTGFTLKEAFIAIGNNFIEVGDLEPSEEKTIEVLLDTNEVYKRLDNFLDSRYGRNYNVTRADRTKQWAENNKKRNILQSVINYISPASSSSPVISLYAFNYDDPEYELIINNQKPKVYNTNIVYSAMSINFEKNKRLTLPTGIVKAIFIQGDNKSAYIEDPNQGSIRAHEDTDVDFIVSLPSSLEADKIKIIWDNVIPPYVKYQSSNTQAQKFAKNTHKYYIFNNSTGSWDEISSGQVIDRNISRYVNSNMEIKLRANIKVDKSASPGELLGTPDLEISGVVK